MKRIRTRAGTRLLGSATALCLIVAYAGCGRNAAEVPATPQPGANETALGPLATLTAAAGLLPVAVDTAGAEVAALPAEQMASLKLTQEALDAAAEIAPIRPFVKRQTPLATFTADPSAPKPSGTLVYVRAGQLYESPAGGGQPKPVAMERPMPRVWSPPEDPGRAWSSPNGQWLALMVGPTAEMWLSQPTGRDNHAVSGGNLPSHMHEVAYGALGRQEVRLLPGMDYTLVLTPGGESPAAVLVDDNSRHVRGEGRLRIVHAWEAQREKRLVVTVNGAPMVTGLGYGQASRNERVPAGLVVIEVQDEAGKVLMPAAKLELADRELVTVFLHGHDRVAATQVRYEPGTRPASGHSRVRIFNSGRERLSVTVDGRLELARDLEPGSIGSYVEVKAVASEEQMREFGQALYGLRSREQPVAWSPDGRKLAFLGAGDAQIDLYVAAIHEMARRVTDDPREELNPVWSPDSSHLAWLSVDPAYGHQAIYYVRTGGQPSSVDLTPLRQATGWAPSAPITFRYGVYWLDNDHLAAYPSSKGVNAGIWVVDTRSGELRPAIHEPVTNPAWSPTARAWAFERDSGGIWVLPFGGEPRLVARGEAHAPEWSPDGRLISYVEGPRLSTEGWRLHVVRPDGSEDRALTDWSALVQQEPPAPGVRAKRFWLRGGEEIVFTLAGTDYGAAEEAGLMGQVEAGNDIENVWMVATDGSESPRRLTDLTRVFYIKEITSSPRGDSLAFVGFSYLNRTQHLWVVSTRGGKPVAIDAPVRWFMWRSD